MSVVVRLMLPPLKAIKIDRGPRLPKYLRAIPRKGSRLKQAFRNDGPGFGKASFRSGQTERRFSVDGESQKTERPILNPKGVFGGICTGQPLCHCLRTMELKQKRSLKNEN